MQLTSKQKDVLSAINEMTMTSGIPPTLKEIQEYLGYASTSSVQRHTEALKKKGYIISEKFQSRNLRVKGRPEQKHSIPLVGVVSCGSPILAEENIEAYIPFRVDGDPTEYFFLRAMGDSMNKSGIDDGDLVLVKKQSTADYGDKVVALIGDEATIKIFKRGDSCIVLEPNSTNKKHKPLYIFEDMRIQGKVVDKLKI